MDLFYEWAGRIDKNTKGKRLHQVVENTKIDDVVKSDERHIGIVGFECDEGVKRNKGRIGAAKAPNHIRKLLGSIPYHYEVKSVIDIGNIQCLDNDLEAAQSNLGKYVAKLINKNFTPIILGGGHETFYGHYLGAREAVGDDKKIGMINLDAHFDLRMDEIPSSGTMFRQILESDKNAEYLCVGLQELGNIEQLFKTAEEFGVEYIFETEIQPFEKTFAKIDAFAKKQDYVIYTICTDVINQAYAPGVSAPAPFGLEPKTVRAITEHVVKLDNFLSFDVSEVNPTLDVADQTARLISYVIAETFMHLNKKSKRGRK
ncbi:formiminoglutamase [Pseudogracilibacillus auburnensis]|uniref:Formimidoylglutamase n=1 Tax=Pseudogracilibacillus auburnensis TaxID=1494959 RepID=A0A2V3VYP7_9BACI|nr:formimidoylglutamase [Pseudogracilibacillus auburnensis]PXW87143.1 formiminoglutamase [Pseudogracilibacillus auburnensis]